MPSRAKVIAFFERLFPLVFKKDDFVISFVTAAPRIASTCIRIAVRFRASDPRDALFEAWKVHASLLHDFRLFDFLSSSKRGLSLKFYLERPLITDTLELLVSKKGLWAEEGLSGT